MTKNKIKYLGYVTDITNNQKFWFDSLCTVPEKTGGIIDGELVYNSKPVLAPKKRVIL